MSRSYRKAIEKGKDGWYHKYNNRLVRRIKAGEEPFSMKGRGYRKIGEVWNVIDWVAYYEFDYPNDEITKQLRRK